MPLLKAQTPKTTDATHTDGRMATLPGTAAIRQLVQVLLSQRVDHEEFALLSALTSIFSGSHSPSLKP